VFSKLSRYRKVPDAAVPDPRGRVLAAKDVRLVPAVTGSFRHTVAAGDRLDELATRYYGQPLHYWHICDANPGFLSPLALLDREPVVTTDFPLAMADGAPPPWPALIPALARVLGVETVVALEDVEIVPRERVIGGTTVTVFVEHRSRRIRITYNRLNVQADALAGRIRAAGVQVEAPVHIGQLGQQIVIPPAPIG
jgi:Phage Tail Protein X